LPPGVGLLARWISNTRRRCSQSSLREQLRARCQAQKNNRDATLRQLGLNRTFDLIRQLDGLVYEACKGL